MDKKEIFMDDFVVKTMINWASRSTRSSGDKAVETIMAEQYKIAGAVWNEMEGRDRGRDDLLTGKE